MKRYLLFLFLFLCMDYSYGQTISLDSSFAARGWTVASPVTGTNRYDGDVLSLQLQDGKVLAVLDVGGVTTLARYNLNGTLDLSYGQNGYSSFLYYSPQDAALQADGKVVVIGYTYSWETSSDFVVMRYNKDGSIDTNFGNQGVSIIDFNGSDDVAFGIAIQADGKILVSGSTFETSSDAFALIRLNTNGTLDESFSADGKVTTMIGTNCRAYSIALQTDGKILVAGKTFVSPTEIFALARYNSDGSLDTSFDADGMVSTSFGADQYAAVYSLAVQADGKIVAGGSNYGGSTSQDDFALARYKTNGSLDSTFGTNGLVQKDIFGQSDFISTIALQPDNKIVALGYAYKMDENYNVTDDDVVVTRYNSNGSLDTGFDTDGMVTTDAGIMEGTFALALQSNGKFLIGGNARANAESPNYDYLILCYTSTGSLDNSFNSTGKILANYPYVYSSGFYAMTIQADSKVVVAGYTYTNEGNSDFLVSRYNVDGSVDNSFGTNGVAITDFNGLYDYAYAIAIQADGKIVVAGGADSETSSTDFAIARYNTNGTLDNTFGSGGKTTIDFGFSNEDRTNSIAIHTDGKILVAGPVYSGSTMNDFGMARLNTNGSLDNTFGTNGLVMTDFDGNYDYCYDMKVQADGKIILGGSASPYASYSPDFAIARYSSSGSLDNTFGTNGLVLTQFGGEDEMGSLAIQADGKIIAAGYTYSNGESGGDFALSRYKTDGSLDSSFNEVGMLTTDISGTDDFAYTVMIDNNSKIIVQGGVGSYSTRAIAFTRYNNDGTLDDTFSAAGKFVSQLPAGIYPPDAALLNNRLYVSGEFSDYTYMGLLAAYKIGGTSTLTTWYRDADSDTYGDAGVSTQTASKPTGYVSDNTDCNDANDAIHPGAEEVCDGLDNNCNGSIDEGLPLTTYYRDADGDTYGDAGVSTQTCGNAPTGYVSNNTDCNDANNAINPGASEVCDGIDNNCNGSIDEGLTITTYYRDADGDTYGDAGVTTQTCGNAPTGYVSNNTDCNDANDAIHPGATEVCDGVDNDCDGSIDEGTTPATYYRDADGDTYGDAGVTTQTCGSAPTGYVSNNTDCNDGNNAIHPGAAEICDGLDNDCDGSIDEGLTLTTYYRDADADTYGNAGVTTQTCGSAPTGYVSNNTDCNDADASIHPGAKEICGDGKDNNCDGTIDEGCIITRSASIDDVSVAETAGTATLTIRLNAASTAVILINYATQDNTALSKGKNPDYRATKGTVAFAAGETEKTITVPIRTDKLTTEGDETFYVNISLGRKMTGVADISDGQAIVTITDGPAIQMLDEFTRLDTKTQPLFTVSVIPNPSDNYFNLELQSSSNLPVSMKVMDVLGRLIDSKTSILPNKVLQVGQNYQPGVYYAELIQGNEKQVVKLVKQ